MSDLLVVGCSDRKRATPHEPVAALERYDGVFFRVLRKWLRVTEGASLTVLIISARFGLIEATTPIPNYDQRMTSRRAAELVPQIQSAILEHFKRKLYHRIFVNVGHDYLLTLAGIEELSSASWAKGGIGERAHQMKQWLEGVDVRHL